MNNMMNKNLACSKFIAAIAIGIALVSCSDDSSIDLGTDPIVIDPTELFNIVSDVEIDTDQGIYITPTASLDTGSVTFVGKGMELYSVRSARVMARNGYVYNLDYGGGKLYQFINNSDGETYIAGKQLDVSLALDGETYVRPTMVDDNTILIHVITTVTDEETQKVTSTMRVVAVQIPEMTILTTMEPFVIPETEWDTAENRYVGRVDCPVVLDDKVYYGVSRSEVISDSDSPYEGVHTIVLDYPSLENPTYIRSEITKGHTNGYRGTSALAIDGYVYQINQTITAGDPTTIVRLKDGLYDESYLFNISDAIGISDCYANSWYYAGDGIAYMPIRDNSLYNLGESNPEGDSNSYTVARIDIYNNTAVKMNVPYADLFKYQCGVVSNERFYMAISPNPDASGTVQKASIYSFDINSTSADGFTTGADLDDGSIFIQGIY